jgi:PKD repeat protein
MGYDMTSAFGSCANDGIVALWSQQANLSDNALTLFTGLNAVHTKVTGSLAQGDRARQLLDDGLNFGSFASLPAGPSYPLPQCGTLAPATSDVATNGGVLLTPSRTTVTAGQSFTVTVQSYGAYVATSGLLVTSYGDAAQLSGTPLSATFTVPADLTGAFDVMAITNDGLGHVSPPASVRILVDAGAALQSLRIDGSTGLTLTGDASSQPLHVFGKFADSVERELPEGDSVANGMLLHATMTSSNPAAVTVNAQGLLVAHDPGTAVITVTSGTLTATASVIVRASAHPACSDGIDNDGDGLVDYPNDPGCRSANDLTEYGGLTRCDDGLDNDGDEAADYPADAQCTSAAFDFENAAPAASASVSCTNLVCTFDGRASTGDASLASYAWSFGDGTTGTGAVVTHTYAAAGDVTATLQVTDVDGQSGTTTVVASPTGP